MPKNKQKGGAEIILFRFIEMTPEIGVTDKNSNNIIHHVVSSGDIGMVKHILKIADNKNQLEYLINEYNGEGMTPLHIAVTNNLQEIAEILIYYGADENIPDSNGQRVIYVPEQTGGDDSRIIYGKRFL